MKSYYIILYFSWYGTIHIYICIYIVQFRISYNVYNVSIPTQTMSNMLFINLFFILWNKNSFETRLYLFLGDFGTYQWRQFLLHLLSAFTAGLHMMTLSTVAAEPEYVYL